QGLAGGLGLAADNEVGLAGDAFGEALAHDRVIVHEQDLAFGRQGFFVSRFHGLIPGWAPSRGRTGCASGSHALALSSSLSLSPTLTPTLVICLQTPLRWDGEQEQE